MRSGKIKKSWKRVCCQAENDYYFALKKQSEIHGFKNKFPCKCLLTSNSLLNIKKLLTSKKDEESGNCLYKLTF